MGNSAAMNNIGVCYEDGRGVTKDINLAKEWYKKAAAKGHVGAKEAFDRLNQ